jgi:cysteine desulfurase
MIMLIVVDTYLDNAATTKPYASVVAVMDKMMREEYGNPSSTHALGQKAKAILEQSRKTVADALHVQPDEIYFTSGGTESDNLAITGTHLAANATGNTDGNIVTTTLEHPAVIKPIRSIKRLGRPVDYVGVKGGDFDLKELEASLNDKTILISCMAVQNELGYKLPLDQIAAARDRLAPQALFHSDAVQAFAKLPLYPQELGIDMMTLSGHKIGGPKGIGALYVKRGTKLFSTALGGGQERGLRSGTEALPLIASFAEAVRVSTTNRHDNYAKASMLWHYLEAGLKRSFENVMINSREDGSPYIMNFTLPNVDNNTALDYFSEQHIYLSKASACSSNHANVPKGTWRPKHPRILELAGVPKRLTHNTFRVSFCPKTSKADIKRLLAALRKFCSNQL